TKGRRTGVFDHLVDFFNISTSISSRLQPIEVIAPNGVALVYEAAPPTPTPSPTPPTPSPSPTPNLAVSVKGANRTKGLREGQPYFSAQSAMFEDDLHWPSLVLRTTVQIIGIWTGD